MLLVVFLQFTVNQDLYAQKDSFFTYDNNEYYRNVDDNTAPNLPYSHGLSEDYQSTAPVGNGLLVLSLLGAGYLVKKSRKNRNKKNNIKSFSILVIIILSLGFSAEAQNYYFDKPVDSFDGNNMTVYGQLKIDGEFADENIEIGAFCGDEVRGRAFIRKQGSMYLFFLMVYGNANDEIELHFYDHEIGNTNEPFDFNFKYYRYYVTIDIMPEIAGTLSGDGEYKKNDTCFLKVTTNIGYIFEGLYENDTLVTNDTLYSFEVDADRHFIAQFLYIESLTEIKKDYFSIYPNPATDFIIINIEAVIMEDVKIYDMTGKLVAVRCLQPEDNRIDISDIPSGVYVVTLGRSRRLVVL